MSSDLLGMSDEIESVLFVGREVMVYRLPPRTSTEGYKAAAWNDQGFLWKGRIRVLEKGDKCEIRLEDPSTGELFALTRYTAPYATAVEPVLDSSRYFVLRAEGDEGRKAYIGMGFQERGDAFDFNVALQSFAKRQNGGSGSSANDAPDSKKPPPPPQDFSLKAGQTFSIKIPGREGRRTDNSAGAAKSSGPSGDFLSGGFNSSGGIPLLAPPPPSGRKR